MVAELERRTREEFGDEQATHLEYAEFWVASGNTLEALALSIGGCLGERVHREALRRYLYSLDSAAEERLTVARARGAHGLAEQSIEVLEAEMTTALDVSRAAARSRGRQWLAERWNSRELGQQKGVSVAISFGDMHLAALQRRSVAVAVISDPQPTALLEGTSDEGADVQVVDAE